jgi:hypothetical protein
MATCKVPCGESEKSEEGRTVERRYYTAESLERELRVFEDRYGIGSQEFYETYRTNEVPPEIPGFEGFVWADTYSELCRLRADSSVVVA